MGTGAAPAAGGRVMINVFDGRRQPFSDGKILVTMFDGRQNMLPRVYMDSASQLFSGFSLEDNFADQYRIIVSAPGYKDAGFYPVQLKQQVTLVLNLMLIPKSNQLNFGQARWADVKTKRPRFYNVLRDTTEESAARRRYSDLEDEQGGEVLACLLNLLTASDQLNLRHGTPIDYLKAIIWGDPSAELARDRCFGWADVKLLDELAGANDDGVMEPVPYVLHPGATGSYKQIQFGEANLQVTIHGNDRQSLSGVDCVKVELDIDYYRDPAAHFLLEVAVNAFGHLTDPRAVYALRWIAGQKAGIPEFDPLYTIEKA